MQYEKDFDGWNELKQKIDIENKEIRSLHRNKDLRIFIMCFVCLEKRHMLFLTKCVFILQIE